MQASPPATVAHGTPNSSPADPAVTSPSRGPPATTTMNTPCSRPRNWSGEAACRIVIRNTALTASAAPASARHPAAGQTQPDTPAAQRYVHHALAAVSEAADSSVQPAAVGRPHQRGVLGIRPGEVDLMADDLRRENQHERIAVGVNPVHVVQLECQRIGDARRTRDEIPDRMRVKIGRPDKEILAHTHVA